MIEKSKRRDKMKRQKEEAQGRKKKTNIYSCEITLKMVTLTCLQIEGKDKVETLKRQTSQEDLVFV